MATDIAEFYRGVVEVNYERMDGNWRDGYNIPTGDFHTYYEETRPYESQSAAKAQTTRIFKEEFRTHYTQNRRIVDCKVSVQKISGSWAEVFVDTTNPQR